MPDPTPAGYSDVVVLGKFLELDATPPAAADQQLIADIANNLRGEFEGFIRWDPTKQVRVELYPGMRKNLCLLKYPVDLGQPLIVNVDPTRVFASTTVIDPSMYQAITNRSGRDVTTWIWFTNVPLSRGWIGPGGWSDPSWPTSATGDHLKDIIQITYTAGYAALPGDYLRVFNTELKTEWLRRKSPHINSVASQGNTVSTSQPWGFNKETIRVLTRFRSENPFF